MSVTFNKFNPFVANLANGGLNLGSDTIKIFLTNTAPSGSSSSKYSDESGNEIANGNGYSTGGATVTITSSAQSGGTYKLVGNSVVWTASGGSIGPFRYAIIYDATGSNKYLLGYWDYGSSISVNNGDTFTVTLDGTNGILQLA